MDFSGAPPEVAETVQRLLGNGSDPTAVTVVAADMEARYCPFIPIILYDGKVVSPSTRGQKTKQVTSLLDKASQEAWKAYNAHLHEIKCWWAERIQYNA